MNITVVEKYDQYYVRFENTPDRLAVGSSDDRDQRFLSTGVAVPPPGSPPEVIAIAKLLAEEIGRYMAWLLSPNPPAQVIQIQKLKEFSLRISETCGDSLKKLIPVFLLAYASDPRPRTKDFAKTSAVWQMANSWHLILAQLGDSANVHPCLLPTCELQNAGDQAVGQQERHAINLKVAFHWLEQQQHVLKGLNPADAVIAKSVAGAHCAAIDQIFIQKGLRHMGKAHNGEQWQLVTLLGVDTPMRFLTACRLKVRPLNYADPDKPAAFCVLNPVDWTIRYNDTKAPKWVDVKLSPFFVTTWLEPYFTKHNLKPGDYVLPAFARLEAAPSNRWIQLMAESGYVHQYAKTGRRRRCLTGYHALRGSLIESRCKKRALALFCTTEALRHQQVSVSFLLIINKHHITFWITG